MQTLQLPSIPSVFVGRNVFITGGTGYMGKVLIEKLLRSCPDIGNIYLLMRPKYGKTVQQRLDKICDNILFDELKRLNKDALKKIIPIEGDVTLLGLGLSASDRKILIENVSLVYNVAATIRFNQPLKISLIINTRGTREVCKLVLELKNVLSFQHVSTAYCQLDKYKVEEELYPPPANWEDILNIVENMDSTELKLITPKLAAGFPNTYTFTKALGESVVKDLCEEKVPTIIFRPTIVVPIFRDPIPGWMDNFNGPCGLIAGRGKGIIRTSYAKLNVKLDVVPVDTAIVAMIKATYRQIITDDKRKISVYNCSGNKLMDVTPKIIVDVGKQVIHKAPPLMLWYPNFNLTESKIMYLIRIYLFQLIPAILVDIVLTVLQKSPQLFKLQTKIFAALESLEYFSRHQWDFVNDKFLGLDDDLSEEDNKVFGYFAEEMDRFKFFLQACITSIPLMFKEQFNYKRNRRIMLTLGAIHYTLQGIIWYYLFKFVYYRCILPNFVQYCQYLQTL